MSSTKQTLTAYLLSLSKPQTDHPFLKSAKSGTLPLHTLGLWLAQDRIYAAHAYPRFIGALIARIPFLSSHSLRHSLATPNKEEEGNQRVLRVLVACLDNIVREVGFFGEVDAKFALGLGVGVSEGGYEERKETRDYTAEMARVSLTGSFEEGIVFLWAMEQVYLEVWTSIHTSLTSLPPSSSPSPSPSTPALLAFADNWTSPAFHSFVQDLRDLVDAFGIEPGTERWARAVGVWERVGELEEAFWPDVDH
ncbi:hypothetical protein JR316_0008759 [Psilocybe cubensis]|uniref:Thiaminase-2/PQQC domain-containing protein n=2 Tax=Psilocybe cubensis TaxID=181762 RepID=A0A8H7XW55_PSICU|nr:hypothetical protein JR316_0008759 [Psilocybe cubensis]KAH9478306.1 hypothetical protein JR316_0008759 [Psilocybe cubensis]